MGNDLVSKSWKATYALVKAAPWLAALIVAGSSYVFGSSGILVA